MQVMQQLVVGVDGRAAPSHGWEWRSMIGALLIMAGHAGLCCMSTRHSWAGQDRGAGRTSLDVAVPT